MAISVEIKNGIYEVISSGTLIVDASDLTTFRLAEAEEVLTIIFKFEVLEKEINQQRKEAKIIDETTLEIIFINYNNALGTYNKELWEIGSINLRKLYLSYVIAGLGETKLKKIIYSFYLGEVVANG